MTRYGIHWGLALVLALLLAYVQAPNERVITTASAELTFAASDAPGLGRVAPGVCALFTPQELTAFVGETLSSPHEMGEGAGCRWMSESEGGSITVDLTQQSSSETGRKLRRYQPLKDLGPSAFTAAYVGESWIARAVVNETSYNVLIAGKRASSGKAEALLREVIYRRPV